MQFRDSGLPAGVEPGTRRLTAAVLAALLLGSCSGSGGLAGPSPAQGANAATPSVAPLAFTRQWNVGPVADIAVGPQAVYVLYAPPTSEGALANATDTRLARIDRTSGRVLTAGPFPFASQIALAGSVVWIGPYNQYPGTSSADSRMLVGVDAVTLATQLRAALPSDGAQRSLFANLASDSGSAWVAYGTHLYRLAATSGVTLASRSLVGVATSIALDPTAQRLYVGMDAAQANGSQASVTEFVPATLKPLVSASTGGADVGGPQVAAGTDDVWVSYATGMLGQVEHRRASDLAALPVAAAVHSNGVRVFDISGMVWVSDTMAGLLMCLDPHTGAVLAAWSAVQGGVVAGDDSSLYFGDINGVASVQPDSRCH